jgi:hypothetical protein
MQQAAESVCDVLVTFEAEQGPGRSSTRSLEIEIYDFVAGRRLANWPALHWIDSSAGHVALSRDDGYRSIKFRLEDILRDELSFTDWPAAVTLQAAEQRVNTLGGLKAMHPLAAMAEMNVYRARGLVSGALLLDGFSPLVGRESAEVLLLGGADEQSRILREWLPAIDVDQLALQIQRRQRVRNEDD